MGARRKARECALQMLFQWEGSGDTPPDILATFWQNQRASPATREFAERLFTGTLAEREEIDALLRQHSEHWRVERMSAVDRSLLRLAVHELRAYPRTPAAVVIDEALEIARRFSSADSVEFINGVLDAVRKSLGGDKKAG